MESSRSCSTPKPGLQLDKLHVAWLPTSLIYNVRSAPMGGWKFNFLTNALDRNDNQPLAYMHLHMMH